MICPSSTRRITTAQWETISQSFDIFDSFDLEITATRHLEKVWIVLFYFGLALLLHDAVVVRGYRADLHRWDWDPGTCQGNQELQSNKNRLQSLHFSMTTVLKFISLVDIGLFENDDESLNRWEALRGDAEADESNHSVVDHQDYKGSISKQVPSKAKNFSWKSLFPYLVIVIFWFYFDGGA